jgi:SAM-dependent methyltransferase
VKWKLKVLTQFVLAHAPGGVRLNYYLQHARGSHRPERVAERIPILAEILAFIAGHKPLEGAVVVEIGTGWEPISPILLHLLGAQRVFTFDHLRHARFALVRGTLAEIRAQLRLVASTTGADESALSHRLGSLEAAPDLESLFDRAGIVYRAPADATDSGLPDGSVDLVYSYAVLEHVPESVVVGLTVESRRILKAGGLAFHAIGLHDHYAGVDPKVSKVNFLRYPEWAWRLFVKNRISYHNRLREREFETIFASHGARIVEIRNRTEPGDVDRVQRMRVDSRFAGMTPQQLAVTYSEMLMSFPVLERSRLATRPPDAIASGSIRPPLW